MNKIKLMAPVALGALFLSACTNMPFANAEFETVSDQTGRYAFAASNVPDVGTAYQYVKSNQDGSNAASVWIYLESTTHTESFKIYPFTWLQGKTDLVTADYDPLFFAASEVDAYLVAPDGNRFLNAETKSDGATLTFTYKGSEYSVTPGCVPAYNYNFDWCDFAFMYRHLIDKDSAFTVGVTAPNSSMTFVYAGEANLTYTGRESHLEHDCRSYTVSGAAFGGSEGHLYTDAATGALVDLDMPVRNNPSFSSFRLTLIGTRNFTVEEWDAFVLQSTKDYF